MTSALVQLNQLVDRGVDYPDAVWLVTNDLGLSDDQVRDLEQAYDDQFA